MGVIHVSLFSGIGGFDLAAQWAGWNNAVSCEINPFSRKILEYYWPNSYHHDDIHSLTKELIHEEIEKRFGKNWRDSNELVLSGGFPCQPYSVIGKRLGKNDSRHLWPEMLRVIQCLQPDFVVGENVLGIVNWNEGMVFEEVCVDLETEGYEVQPYVLPAAGVGAPHRRDRVWFVAYTNDTRGCQGLKQVQISDAEVRERNYSAKPSDTSSQRITSNAIDERLQGLEKQGIAGGLRQESHQQSTRCVRSDWQKFPAQSPVCGGDDGISIKLDGITFSKWRIESIKAYGNAVVPQVVFQIFNTINEFISHD